MNNNIPIPQQVQGAYQPNIPIPQQVQGAYQPNIPMPQQVQGAYKPNIPMPQQVQGAYQPMGGDIKTLCQQYMNYHVIAQMSDGSQFDGIIEGMDEDGVTMLVPEDVDAEQVRQVNEEEVTRQFGYDYDDYDDYGRPRRRRFRRFRRRRFPFRFFRRLFRYPYYYPYYGYGGGY